ncbi:DeoR family transcriptional regulator [Bacillus sp. AFS076308]|uniref:DeoR/GlpR family DNA-binding transcription regulator n=1 Tax=unclassified Bacillus (in: firmicutes) TaxID=185979 RepID=UPI000BFA28F8|nr:MULTISPECIES: DeoR/GlpR family DNA-binding transcription regulator [unclassified Bacillus (in: firmicutes)]PFO06313.1 DeoR family transcriptional regulator [Bacillus sp. AFS076308]PGV53828.1 DeoR family transcriptional regulator [Bacillus sp. AFS037270]
MLVAERQKKIVELVNERLSIRVTELSKIFSVTEETIRRDLEKLEKENLLMRSHGGAVSIEKDQGEISYLEREITNAEQKKAIAAAAVRLIEQGDQIVLDASTTAWYVAKELPDMPLTVLTNSIKVAIELSKKEQIKVISTGGTLLSQSLSYVGPLAERSLSMYHVNKAFLSCKGVHLERGLSDFNESQALLKKQMREIADETILMVDSSKFGTRAFSQIVPVTNIDCIITDSKVDKETKNELEEKKIKLLIVD